MNDGVPPATPPAFGIDAEVAAKLRRLFDRTRGLERVWIYGSRARGDYRPESDIDFAADMPDASDGEFSSLRATLEDLVSIYRADLVLWQSEMDNKFRASIERDRRLFWEARTPFAKLETVGGTQLKQFQSDVLLKLTRYIDELKQQRALGEPAVAALRQINGMEDPLRELGDFPKRAWQALGKAGVLPDGVAEQTYFSRFDGTGEPMPNVCLKVPTGGGKTLLAAASVASVFSGYLNRHAGLVLWVVPNDAIYRQTLKSLSDRDHPYRQLLNVAGAGRVKILEKSSPLSRLDVESHLCVMLLMLQSAARQSKETLRFFRDRGNVLGFLPREDDIDAHWALLQQVPNLDAYAPWGTSSAEARAQKGSIIKSSLGNVMRLIRPMVVIDEGHHAYTENALATLEGFNPSFLLELSATPRAASAKSKGSNLLVNVKGTDLEAEEMIKLPIKVEVRQWQDWQSCLGSALQQLDALQKDADELRADTARYIRPILLVQVERTGAEQRDSGFIHADDAKTYLLQLGLQERQIAIKTSEKDDLKQPENIDLLAPNCEIRVIITKQALQEGWDCPFAYVLCALAAGRNPAAMTQLVGRILRQPQVAKTGRASLDACYVLCHDARTGDVVRGIKKSLESEGMGDLMFSVSGGGQNDVVAHTVEQQRRPEFAKLRLFVPRVTWTAPGEARRELVYDSDILARVPWHEIDSAGFALDWAPDTQATSAHRFEIGLSNLRELPAPYEAAEFDRSRLVRGLIDLAPNAWLVWAWVTAVLARLSERGFSRQDLVRSSGSLLERLRLDVERERDRLAEVVFNDLVGTGHIEFRLRADATDYELPRHFSLQLGAKPKLLTRDDSRAVQKSLLEPAVHTPDINEFEAAFAGYLDQKKALHWWHRNVAKTQYGLQGWKRAKVYPDFVFGHLTQNGVSQTVLLETKGLHLLGSADTRYKQELLHRLTAAQASAGMQRVGELALEGATAQRVVCDIVFDDAWRGSLESRYFSQPASGAAQDRSVS